jgi:hypothetical protein
VKESDFALSALFAIQVSKEISPKLSATIIETNLLVNVLNLLHIMGPQSKVTPKIGLNPRRSFRLWKNGMTLSNGPGWNKSSS